MEKTLWARVLNSDCGNRKSKIQNLKWVALFAIVVALTVCGARAEAQQSKVYRVGVIHQGGPYKAVVDGLRDGLRQLGLEERKHLLLNVRDSKGEVKAVEAAAKDFERDRVNLIFAVTTSATTAVKNVTSEVPIVFSVGSDPVASGFLQNFAIPGGRLTGVQYSATDLTGKRLEILKKRLPTMFAEQSLVVMGGLASYGQNFHEVGRLSAKYVQKIMTGAQPRDLRVETVDKFELIINLKTAKQIGLTIPPNVLARADRVIR